MVIIAIKFRQGTYTKSSQRQLNHRRMLLVFLPVLEHRNMIPDCNVAYIAAILGYAGLLFPLVMTTSSLAP